MIETLEALLRRPFFQFVFWGFALILLFVTASSLLWRQGTLPSIELSLLDQKMRYRANSHLGGETMPDKNIVILGLDGNTDKYIRLHPEKNLNLALPRKQLAQVLNYLTVQGARAVIFDLEFKDKKDGDAVFSKAIRRNGHVYAADRMDYSLNAFIGDQRQSMSAQQASDPGLYSALMAYEGVLRPAMSHISMVRSRFLMPLTATSGLDIGEGPLYFPLGRIDPVLAQLGTALNWATIRASQVESAVAQPMPNADRTAYAGFYDSAFSSLCMNNSYQRYYQNNPDFLSQLREKQFALTVQEAVPADVNHDMLHCYTFPITDDIMASLKGIGIPSIDYDTDAYIRSASALYRGYQGNFYTYLGVRPALDLLNLHGAIYTPTTLTLGSRTIPLLDGQKILINWRSPRFLVEQLLRDSHINPESPALQSTLDDVSADHNNPILGGGHIYRQISMIDVLRTINHEPMSPDEAARLFAVPHIPSSGAFSFKDKIVIVGNTVTDIHRTPMSNTMFGPEVVASVLDMTLHDRIFVQKPHFTFQWGIVLVLSILIVIIIIAFQNLVIGFSAGLILITLYWLLNYLVFVYWGYWLDLVMPSTGLGLSLLGATLYRYYVHDREKHQLTNVFSKYVSPQIMTEIIKSPEKALDNLRGGKKNLSVLFADLQNFTQQFETADPEEMVSQLNEYFDVMTDIVLAHGGTYDKYMGDSIMAFFGAPAEMLNHAEMACRTALAMEAALVILNERWAVEGQRILHHGVGVSSGEMFVGNFGSRNIKNFTVMGSNVNLGARLEAYTRVALWPIIISERTQDAVKALSQVRDLGRIHVKGFTSDVQIYGLEAMHPQTPEAD